MDGEKKSEGQQPASDWQYAPEEASMQPKVVTPASSDVQEITWTASEYIAHHKGTGWYAVLVVVAIFIGMLVYLISHDLISTGVVGFMSLLFGVAAGQKPRVLSYKLSRDGMTIGKKFYPYSEFKSFSVVDEGAFSSILFMPLKRFIPPFSIYYEPEDEEKIVELLSIHLPVVVPKNDFIDLLMRQVRF